MPALLPDYAVLRPHVLEAQEVANKHGIALLNPYCGLPLCVGWSESMGQSVESIEALSGHTAQGLKNDGNKRHGSPCIDCGVRSRCGGAWHAYWTSRSGSGISAPWHVPLPWEEPDHRVHVIDARGQDDRTIERSETPAIARWYWCNSLAQDEWKALIKCGVSHVMVDCILRQARPQLAQIRRWSNANNLMAPQRRIHFHLRLDETFHALSAQAASDFLTLAGAVGVVRVHTTKWGQNSSRIVKAGLARPA